MNRHTALLLAALILSAVPPPGRAQSGTADAPGYRYLLKDVALTVDSDGQKTLVFRRQLEILRRDAVDEVGDISVPYNAFRSTARVLRAETRTADGRRLPVPKEDIRDLIPEDVQGYQMYDDVRQLTFSMPGLAPGAILDYEVEIRERRPVMPGQFWDTQFLDDYVPVATSRFVVTLPARREFAARAGGTGVASNEVVQGSRRVLTWERRDIPAVPWEFQGPPPEEYRTFVRLSSLTNWDTVGQWYAGVLAGLDWNAAPVREKAAQLVQGHTGDLARIQALYEFAAQDVRYVGVELGRSDFTPHPPAQTLKNMYGDCKDKAALLVALMRAAGLTGHVALVRPNQAGPLDHQAPHPNQFSHAIVHVPRPAGPLWIDATVPRQDVRTYGRYLDGGEPLVMSGRPGVIAVPALPPRPDIQRTRYEIRARPGGLCLVDVLHEWENQAAADQRARWEENALNRYEQQVRENLTNETGYTRALEIRPPNASALTAPFRHGARYESDHFLTAMVGGHQLWLNLEEAASYLYLPPAQHPQSRRRRQLPVVSPGNQVVETVFRLHLPPNLKVARPPTPFREELPQGVAELIWTDRTDGAEATLRVTQRPVRLTPAELADAARRTASVLPRLLLRLELVDSDLVHLQKAELAPLRADLAAARTNAPGPDTMFRTGRYLLRIGRLIPARRAFEELIRAAPDDLRGYEGLADTHRGWWGQPGPGLDRAAARATLDRAAARPALRNWAELKLVELALCDDFGIAESPRAPLAEAEQRTAALIKARPDCVHGQVQRGVALRLLGHRARAEDAFRKAIELDQTDQAAHLCLMQLQIESGRSDEALQLAHALSGNDRQALLTLTAVSAPLLVQRQYGAVADLYEAMAEGAERPAAIRSLASGLRQLAAGRTNDYTRFFDQSTPESALLTATVANFFGDTGRLARVLIPAYPLRATTRVDPGALIAAMNQTVAMEGMREFYADCMVGGIQLSSRALEGGDVEVTAKPREDLNLNQVQIPTSMTRGLAERSGDGWRLLAAGLPMFDLVGLGRGALDRLAATNLPGALNCVRHLKSLAEPASKVLNLPVYRSMAQLSLAEPADEVRAWAAYGLLASDERRDAARAAAVFTELCARRPDPTLHLLRALATFRIAGPAATRKALAEGAAAPPATIDQQDALFTLQMSLDDLDGATRTLERLRALSPPELQLLHYEVGLAMTRQDWTALAALQERLRSHGDSGRVALIRVLTQSAIRRGDEAALQEMVQLVRAPRTAPTLRHMVLNIALNLGRADLAEELLGALFLQGDRSADWSNAETRLAALVDDREEVAQTLKRSQALFGRRLSKTGLREDGLIRLLAGDQAGAADAFRRWLDAGPEHDPYPYCMAAAALARAGRSQEAQAARVLARREAGEEAWPTILLDLLEGRRTPEQARAEMEARTPTYEHADHRCEIAWHLAMQAETAGRTADARRLYEEAAVPEARGNREHEIARAWLNRAAARRATP